MNSLVILMHCRLHTKSEHRNQRGLLFYTDYPNAWHTALHKANNELKMSENRTMTQLYIDSNPKWNIYIFNNGTVIVQSSVASLDTFVQYFNQIKPLVAKLKTSPPKLPTTASISFVSQDVVPSVLLLPPPAAHIPLCMSLSHVTPAVSQHLREDEISLVSQHRDKIRELPSAIRCFEEDN